MANIIDLLVAKSAEQQLSKLEKDLKKIHNQIIDINKQNITFASGASSQTINDLIAKTQAFDKAQRDQAQTLEKLLRLQRSHNQTQMSANRLREQQASAADRAAARTEREARRVRDASSAYMQLSRAEAEAARRLQDLIAGGVRAGQTQRQHNDEVRRAQAEFDRLRARIILADNATGRWSRTNQRSIVGIRGMATGLTQLISAFGVFGGIYLFAGAMKDAFNTVKDFDKANADLAATMGKSRAQITALTNDQKRLGASTKFTATEVAGLQKEFAKLGFTEQEILNATEATLNLAAAVGTDLENSAMVAGQTLRGFGLDASEMNRVTDVMAASFTASALDIENFRESMKYVAPIAAQTGVSIEFATAMLGKLADAGVKGSQAGTSLRRILTEMAKTGLPAAEAFNQVAKSGLNVTDAMDEVGRTAQTSLLILSKTKDEVFGLEEALEGAGGAAEKMANEQLNSLDGQLTLLTSAWDGFILALSSGDSVITKVFVGLVKFLNMSITGLTYFLETADEGAKRLAAGLQKETYTALLDNIFSRTDKLKKSLSELNSEIRKQNSLLEKDPNNKKILSDLDSMIKKRDEINKKIETENKLIKEVSIDVIAEYEKKVNDANKTIETNTQNIKRWTERIKENIGREEFAALSSNIKKAKEENRSLTKSLGDTVGTLEAYKTALNRVDPKIVDNSLNISENTKKTEKAAKAKKEEIKGLIGSEYWYNKQIASLREVRSKTAANTEAYAEITEQIKHYEEGLESLVNAQKKVVDPKFGTLEYYEKLKRSLEEQQKTLADNSAEWQSYERLIEAVQIDIDILTGKSKESTESLEEQSEAIKGYLEGFVEQFSSESGFGKTFDILRGKIEGFGTDAKVTALAVSEAFQEMFNTISNASNAHFQREYEALENQKEISVLFAGDSAEAREEIEKTYEKRRKKIQREEAEAQKRLAVFNIAVNTAQAIVAALPNIPLSIAIGVIGAAQLAFAQSQSIPAFAEGGEMKNDGLMLVNDAKGSKFQETIETPDGQIIKPKGRNVLMKAKKGTKIYTPDQWDEKTANLATQSITKMNYSAINTNQGVTREDIKNILTNLAAKENYHFSVDSNGVKAMIETNGKKAQIMNSVIKIKGKNV